MTVKKRFINLLSFILVLAILLTGSVTAFAQSSGEWIVSEKRWMYKHYDNTYTLNDWEQINNKWYHFDEKGRMQTEWQKIDDEWYYFIEKGEMVTGWKRIEGKWYLFDESGIMQTGFCSRNSDIYYLKSNGTMTVGWMKIDDKWYYFNENGSMCKITVIIQALLSVFSR